MREKFGRLVLLEQTEDGPLGRDFRAARLGPTGLDRLVNVTCFSAPVSAHAAATKRLMDEARLAARLQNPGLVRVLGIGRVDHTFYLSTELVEGRSLVAVIERCARDAFPFAADHALMVASRAGSALEYLHGKKDDAGVPFFHGLIAPSRLMVMFDGEVKLKGLGLWPALRESGLLDARERRYLAPEQLAGAPGDPRSDVYSLGLALREALTAVPPDGADPLAGLAEARVATVSGEAVPMPKALLELLRHALSSSPEGRFAGIVEMRKAIDTLLFSGDFTPTTFDLAFFMHTLFRDDMENEARAIEEARRADYREFLSEEKPAAVEPAPSRALPGASAPLSATAASAEGGRPAAPGTGADGPNPPVTAVDAARATLEERNVPTTPASAPHTTEAVPVVPASRVARPAVRESAARAAAGLTLGSTAPPSSSGRGLALAAALLLVGAAVGGGYYYTRGRSDGSSTSSTTTLAPEARAAMARVKELEERIAQLERDKAAAEATAAEEARRKLETAAAAKGRAVDPAALARAQEEARQRARADQDKKQLEELRRIEDQRRAEEKRIADATPTPPAAPPPAAPTPTPESEMTPPSTTLPVAPVATPAAEAAVAPGSLVEADDPRLTAPAVLSQVPPRYPALAQERSIAGTVELSALVDETGRVAEVRVVRAAPPRLGFEEAATQHARSRRYKPGTKDGVAVRVWMPIVVKFVPKR